MSNTREYTNIFKSTFLFSVVQVIRIIVSVAKNKVVAVLLGPEGMGIMGIMLNTINLIKTGAGLGIAQSAVRDVSEANIIGDKERFSRVISITQKVVVYTSLFGLAITVLFSPFLSQWGFGNKTQTISFLLLGIAVFFEIFVENQLAILKGMRQLHSLAKASIWGAVVGLVVGVPLFFWLGKEGIVPSLIATAFVVFLVTKYYVSKVEYIKVNVSFKSSISEAFPMIKMGIALMMVSFIGLFFSFIISFYIRSLGGLEMVGLYQAGVTIVTSYIGVVITAMNTDYYPRISAVNKDNFKLMEEVNTQSEVGLLMAFPIIIIFVFLSPLFIDVLYSPDFKQILSYTDYAIIGSVITICSNCMGMILIAKQATKVFLLSVFAQRIICLIIFMLLYQKLGLLGLGFSEIFAGLLHIVLMALIMGGKYNIRFSRRVVMQLLLTIIIVLLSIYIRTFENNYFRYIIGFCIVIFVTIYSLYYIKKYMGLDVLSKLKSRIKINE